MLSDETLELIRTHEQGADACFKAAQAAYDRGDEAKRRALEEEGAAHLQSAAELRYNVQ